MGIPKPITFTAAGEGYDGPAPENFVIVGAVPGGDSGPVAIADVTGLTSALAGKAATTHTHTFTALSGAVAGASGANLQAILNDIQARLAAIETP